MGKELVEQESLEIQEREGMANRTMLLGDSLFIHKSMAGWTTETGGDIPGLDGESGNYEREKITEVMGVVNLSWEIMLKMEKLKINLDVEI